MRKLIKVLFLRQTDFSALMIQVMEVIAAMAEEFSEDRLTRRAYTIEAVNIILSPENLKAKQQEIADAAIVGMIAGKYDGEDVKHNPVNPFRVMANNRRNRNLADRIRQRNPEPADNGDTHPIGTSAE